MENGKVGGCPVKRREVMSYLRGLKIGNDGRVSVSASILIWISLYDRVMLSHPPSGRCWDIHDLFSLMRRGLDVDDLHDGIFG